MKHKTRVTVCLGCGKNFRTKLSLRCEPCRKKKNLADTKRKGMIRRNIGCLGGITTYGSF